MRSVVVVFVIGCGGSATGNKATEPARNVQASTDASAPRQRPDCLDAVEGWFFSAGVANREHQDVFVAACKQDGWSRQTRECFKYLAGSLAPGRDHTPSLSECKSTLSAAQLDGYQRRIESTGEVALDKIEN